MKKGDLRIVFMGTPEFAVATLRALVENDYNVVAVVTQPDKPVGRHVSVLQPSAVKLFAQEHGLPVLQPEKMKDPAFVEQLRAYHANLQVVVAFRMLPEVVWSMPEYGTFNVHAALLPQYRGAAPINWAIINGETLTGVTTFFLDHDIDTGQIIMNKPCPIADDDNVETVYNQLMGLGAEVCLETIEAIIEADGYPVRYAQQDTGELKLAPKIFKETCQINWQLPVKRIYDFVRGLSPYPGAWTTLVDADGRETVLKIFRTTKTDLSALKPGTITTDRRQLFISTADCLLQIDELQLAGKKRMDAVAFLNGMKDIDKYFVR
ncbi:MAG: methionyl-tRNA formyltransferase [Prevotella sp.]|nr:methionyl-tRNA formyltransferase [Prevotella sp.]